MSDILSNELPIDIKKGTKRTASARRKQMRLKLWPDISDEQLWIRTQRTGFTTIPRTMNLIGRILDSFSGKGFPLSDTYLTLWCWVFDEAFVEIHNPMEFAYESGFNGSRAESVWKIRMRRLEELGFIKAKPGLAGDFHYVLLLNPIQVIEHLYQDRTKDIAYRTLIGRLVKTGADDIDL